MSSERKKLVSKLDKVFSEYIRKRDKHRCIVCGATKELRVIQCGHLFSRVSPSTRWDEANAHAQCAGCNLRHEHDPEPFRRAWLARHNAEQYDRLYAKWSNPTKFTAADLEMMIQLFKEKIKKLEVSNG